MTRKSEAGGYKNVTYLRQSHESETRKETHLNIKTFEFIEETNLCMTVTQTNEWPDNRNHRLVTVSVKDSIPASRGPRQSRGENCKMIDSRHRHSPLWALLWQGPGFVSLRNLSLARFWSVFLLYWYNWYFDMLNHIWSYSVVPHLIFLSQRSNVQKNHLCITYWQWH